MSFDLERTLEQVHSYNSDTQRNAKHLIRQEFARLSILEPELETYKEIAARQARQIAELNTVIEGLKATPHTAPLAPSGTFYNDPPTNPDYFEEPEA